jgi:hypothetical protein
MTPKSCHGVHRKRPTVTGRPSWATAAGKPVRVVQGSLGSLWHITSRLLSEALAAGGAEAKRAFDAMMPMTKIDTATIETAPHGGQPRS